LANFSRKLRVNQIRVFYDVTKATAEVLAIVTKAQAQAWLDAEGTPKAPSAPGSRQG
jgi:hypothetical protein